MAIRHYRELIVWQRAMELARICYEGTRTFPKSEIFGLTGQIRRAAVSIAANIAEGHARIHTKEYLKHLSFARGSLAELETHLIFSRDVQLLDEDQLQGFLAHCDEISRMLAAMRLSLERRVAQHEAR